MIVAAIAVAAKSATKRTQATVAPTRGVLCPFMLIPPRDRDVLRKTPPDGGKLRNLFLKIAVVAALLGAATIGTASADDQQLTEVPVILGHGNFFLIDPSTGGIPVAANLSGLVPLPAGGRLKDGGVGIFNWT